MDTLRRWCDEESLRDSIADRHRSARGLAGHAADCEQKKAWPSVDVAILTRPQFDKLVGTGKLVGGTGAPLAHVPIGLAVRAGSRQPDIRTVVGPMLALRVGPWSAHSCVHLKWR